jgi:glycosyltransferase involved in cell wall biosynthesis
MFAGDSLSHPSGLAYVAKSIMSRFADNGHKISYMTLNGVDTTPDGLAVQGEDFHKQFKEMPIYNCQSGKDRYDEVEKAIHTARPNVVFTIHDPWVIDPLAYNSLRESYMLTNYVTVEIPEYPERVLQANPLKPKARKSIADVMQTADVVIPVTGMGKKALEKMDVECVPHIYNGLDTDLRCTKDLTAQKVFGDAVSPGDFIFMTMGLNSARKSIDKVLEAFHAFLEKMKFQKKYKMYLHTDVHAASGGTDLREMVKCLGMDNHVLIAANMRASVGLDKEELYRRYKACDCYVGMPAGEGFGYGFAEAMMHGLPLVYINYGGHTDYCKPAGLPADVLAYTNARNAYMKWAVADPQSAAKSMARIVSDTKLRERLGKEGERIALEELSWDVIFPKIYKQVSDGFSKYMPNSLNGIMMRRLV